MKSRTLRRLLELAVCDLILGMSFVCFPEKTSWICKITSSAALLLIHILYIPDRPSTREVLTNPNKKSPVEKPLTKFLYVLIGILAAVSIFSAIWLS